MSLQERAACQLAEIELLTSMFPTLEELETADPLAVAELRDYADGSSPSASPPSSRPQFVIRQKLRDDSAEGVSKRGGRLFFSVGKFHRLLDRFPPPQVEFTLSCTFPPEYPSVIPQMTVRSSGLSQAQQTRLHSGLNAYLTEACLGEVCVLSAVDWLRDNLAFVNKRSSSAPPEREGGRQEAFCRLWIYSHHIYNNTKRKNILEWAKELGLSGFSMPGKPGIVCVEGPRSACEEFWSRVKVLSWKRIMIRHREDISLLGASVDSLRKFSGFEEAVFEPHGTRGDRMDLGLLYQFLQEKGCCDVFQMYFGMEGR